MSDLTVNDLIALGFSYYAATYDEPRNQFFCGYFHVTQGAFWIGIVGFLLAWVQLGCSILLLILNPGLLPALILIRCCISMLVFFCLIFAKQIRKPWICLPFLIVKGIELLVLWALEGLLFVYLLFRLLILFLQLTNAETDDDQSIFDRTSDYDAHSALDSVAGLGTLAVLFIFLGNSIVLFFTYWTYRVVWSAWRFMRRELAHQQEPFTVPTIPISVPVTQHQQVPTSVAGESVPSTLIDIDPVIPQQQVPTDGVEESLPSTSSDNAPATHLQPDLTADGVEEDQSLLAKFHDALIKTDK